MLKSIITTEKLKTMKNYFVTLLCLLGILGLMTTSCEDDQDCLNCKVEGVTKTTFVVDAETGKTITVYPVMTPTNHNMCDSMVYSIDKGSYVEPYEVHSFQKLCTVQEARDSLLAGNDTACPCRVNPETSFNDNKNSFFYIENIEEFPYNRLFIKTGNDSTKLRIYTDYDNVNNLFIGEVALDTTTNYYEYNNTKQLTSGVYSYMIVLYKEAQHFTVIGDTIKGDFAIIRNNRFLNKNCKEQAFDQSDPLLK